MEIEFQPEKRRDSWHGIIMMFISCQKKISPPCFILVLIVLNMLNNYSLRFEGQNNLKKGLLLPLKVCYHTDFEISGADTR